MNTNIKELTKFFSYNKSYPDTHCVPINYPSYNTYNFDLNLYNFQSNNLSSRTAANFESIDTSYNTKLLNNKFGEYQARTLGDKFYEPVNVLDMNNDPVLKRIRVHNMSIEDNSSLEIGLKQFSTCVHEPASASTEGGLNMVCCNNPNYYNNLYNSLEHLNLNYFHPHNWNYIQQQILDLATKYDPSSVSYNLYLQRRKAIIEGHANITKIENYDNAVSDVADHFFDPFQIDRNNQFLTILCETFDINYHHVHSGLVFVMFCTLMKFKDWVSLQSIIFIKDNFLIFIKSILFKMKTYSLTVPDIIKRKISRCYGFILRLNNCKIFLGFSIKTNFMLVLLNKFTSIFPSDMLQDVVINDSDIQFIKNLPEESCSDELKKILLSKNF